ncbi:hypothetical protein ACIOKD_01565 [Streptomyces sp. NPDC087844]|uniref:hypothetical protein n=1 Tax=Streptomyces sp. NPDC087844 TaxID=3365805 RepID=UPI0038261280
MDRILRRWWPVAVLTCLALAALIARGFLVDQGVLYGRMQVLRVDGMIAAVAVIALAFGLAHRPAGSAPRTESVAAPERWNIVTGALGLLVLIVSVVSLFSPVDRPGLPKAACPNARTQGAPYVGMTSGKLGNNSRSGPGRAFPANGRFPADCSVGFTDYCLGDPILDDTGSTEHQEWVTGRWLRMIKQPPDWRRDVAGLLSDEKSGNQFIADAFVIPATNYEGLELASEEVCGPQFPAERAKLGTFTRKRYPGVEEPSTELAATSDHAVNIGFSVYLPPGEGFREKGMVFPLYDESLAAPQNPGRVSPKSGNRKTITWAYSEALRARLLPGHEGSAHIVLMAIPCIGNNLPDEISKGDLARYDITPKGLPRSTALKPAERSRTLRTKLAQAACQANV